MKKKRAAFLVAISLAALVVAALLPMIWTHLPSTFRSTTTQLISKRQNLVLWVVSLLALVVAISQIRSTNADLSAHKPHIEGADPPNPPHSGSLAVGDSFNSQLVDIQNLERRSNARISNLESKRDEIRERLQATTIRLHQQRTGLAYKAASNEVESGDWTTDVRAAAFLGGPDAPRPTFIRRVIDRIFGRDEFKHRVIRTISVMEREFET